MPSHRLASVMATAGVSAFPMAKPPTPLRLPTVTRARYCISIPPLTVWVVRRSGHFQQADIVSEVELVLWMLGVIGRIKIMNRASEKNMKTRANRSSLFCVDTTQDKLRAILLRNIGAV